jgi:hypothetical protein
MLDDIPQGYNIGWDVIGDRCVTTGAVPSSHPFGGYYLKFETIIWHWNEKERGNIIHMINHKSKKEAIKVHNHIVNNLKECLGE